MQLIRRQWEKNEEEGGWRETEKGELETPVLTKANAKGGVDKNGKK